MMLCSRIGVLLAPFLLGHVCHAHCNECKMHGNCTVPGAGAGEGVEMLSVESLEIEQNVLLAYYVLFYIQFAYDAVQ
jgi:hypothetical protein